VDALQPQLYWRIAPPAQSYPLLLDWWVQQNTKGRHIYAGNYLSRIDPGLQDWPVEEIRDQVFISHSDANRQNGSWGNIMFSAKAIRDDIKGCVDLFRTEIYPYQALTPPLTWLSNSSSTMMVRNAFVDASIAVEGVQLNWDEELQINKAVVYQLEKGMWKIHRVVRTDSGISKVFLALESGTYAVTGVDRFRQETKKHFFEV
jgi:hypothetical protein